MARAIEAIDLSEELWYEETVNGVTTTTKYWPIRKDSDGVLLLRAEVMTARRINPTNVAAYIDSEMDTWLNNADDGYLSYFDATMQACIVPTQIKVKPYDSTDIVEVARQVFLLSESEVNANGGVEGDSILDALKTHRATESDGTARIAYNVAGISSGWWLRTAGSITDMRFVHVNGQIYNVGSASAVYAPRPAFKVRNGTMVSDSGQDTIYILPDATHLYRDLEYAVVCGETDARPKRGKVEVEITNATESKICLSNNAGDASPTWVECQNGVAVDLPNMTKETDKWKLGVKIYAKSGGRATCGEPAIIVEVDGE